MMTLLCQRLHPMLNTRSLTEAAHAPGDLYSQAVPLETAREAIRGHN